MREHSVLDPEEYAAYLARLEELGVGERALPAVLAGAAVLPVLAVLTIVS